MKLFSESGISILDSYCDSNKKDSYKKKYVSFLPLGLKAQRGITIMIAGGWAAVRDVSFSHFYVQFF